MRILKPPVLVISKLTNKLWVANLNFFLILKNNCDFHISEPYVFVFIFIFILFLRRTDTNLKNHPDTQYGLMFGAVSNTRPTLVSNVHVCLKIVKQVHNLSLHVNKNNKNLFSLYIYI
jgi:hypothetical protein